MRARAWVAVVWLCGLPGYVGAQQSESPDDEGALLEIELTPTARSQIAIWIEDGEGHLRRTLAVTEAVAFRGIGNRPGASQMNSGYRWPYGRREGVLPIWASRRAKAPGARQWKRVIFQNRTHEGFASQSGPDQSRDDYYCLSFNRETTTRDALDAVSCASVFTSDKGRFLTQADVQDGYAEPWVEPGTAEGSAAPLALTSLYPPRMDATHCAQLGGGSCFDHADLTSFAAHAREVMPDIDAVTMATPPGDTELSLLFSIPPEWPQGQYTLWIEVSVEGDYNPSYNAESYPTPVLPTEMWDHWAKTYGYPYRGQPSIAYAVPITLGEPESTRYEASVPAGMSSWQVWDEDYGKLHALAGIADDPEGAPGSGADRLRMNDDGSRVRVSVEVMSLAEPEGEDPWEQVPDPALPDDEDQEPAAPDDATEPDEPDDVEDPDEPDLDEPTQEDDGEAGSDGSTSVDPDTLEEGKGVVIEASGDPKGRVGAVGGLRLGVHDNELRSHEWITLRMLAAQSDQPIHRYEVRVSTEPIVDEQTFIERGRPAKTASDDAEGAVALMLPADVPAGEEIKSAIGDLRASTLHFVAVRAVDRRNRKGPISVATLTTTERTFSTVTPCFVASAAYGSPLAEQVSVLRRFRDRHLQSTAPGRALTAAYYAWGHRAAELVREHPWLARASRAVLSPIVSLASFLSD